MGIFKTRMLRQLLKNIKTHSIQVESMNHGGKEYSLQFIHSDFLPVFGAYGKSLESKSISP